MLTIRDTDLIILSKLNDKDLLSTCLVNKAANKLCNNEDFWRNRFITRYGEVAAKYKPEDRSWKKHYLQVIIDLERFPNPVDFLSHILWGNEGINNSFYIDAENPRNMLKLLLESKNRIPLLKAPEWVMNNLWLLNLGDVKIKIFNNIGSEIIELKGLTPIQLLDKLLEIIIIKSGPVHIDELFNLYTDKNILNIRFLN